MAARCQWPTVGGDRWRSRLVNVVKMDNSGGAAGGTPVVPGRGGRVSQTVQASDSLTGAEETLNGLIPA